MIAYQRIRPYFFGIFTKTESVHCDLLKFHVCGCPVFVLEPKLQNDQNLPKWNRQARIVQFLGFSNGHSSLVANVCNLTTGNILPPFHLVFDELFETVICTIYDDNVFNAICNDLFELNRDLYAKDEHDDNGKPIYQPLHLEDVWIDEQGHLNRRHG